MLTAFAWISQTIYCHRKTELLYKSKCQHHILTPLLCAILTFKYIFNNNVITNLQASYISTSLQKRVDVKMPPCLFSLPEYMLFAVYFNTTSYMAPRPFRVSQKYCITFCKPWRFVEWKRNNEKRCYIHLFFSIWSWVLRDFCCALHWVRYEIVLWYTLVRIRVGYKLHSLMI